MAVVFVHGCFWHHHQGCRYATTPSTRGGLANKIPGEHCSGQSYSVSAFARSELPPEFRTLT
nr:hypothetical protein [Leisingera sp. JC1]